MSADYKYDLAISFLQEDEALALEIADRIGERLTVDIFVYSKRQDDLVGRDGLEAFSTVFGSESRVIAILYRAGWGQTRWTRVEETAIKNRAFDEGPDFLLLIRLDRSDLPKWIPRTQLYLGFEKYGIDGTASALEALVQRAGGMVQSDSAVDFAGRVARKIDFEQEKQDWYNSEKGIGEATDEARTFLNLITALATQMKGDHPNLELRIENRHNTHIIAGKQYGLVIIWSGASSIKSLRGSGFATTFYKGFVTFGRTSFSDSPEEITEYGYDPEIDRRLSRGWRERNGDKKFFKSNDLAEFCLWHLLKLIDSPPIRPKTVQRFRV